MPDLRRHPQERGDPLRAVASIPADLARAEAGAHACDLLLAVGSTLSVYPAAGVVPIAKRNDRHAKVVIVNAEPTDLDHLADVVLARSATSCLAIADA